MPALAVVSRPADHDLDDLDLVARARAGDDRAFEALYLRYQARIAAYVRGMVRDHGRAEDITQEVFLSALRRMRANDAPIAFKPWIYEIAKNACIDAWRRTRNTNEVSFDAQDGLGPDDHGRLADPGVTPAAAVDNKDAIDNLCGAFGGLSQTHHEILVMREFEGLSYREIGERLGMSRPGVESTLFRARKRLSEEYEELVSGERCLRVQRIVDGSGGRATGLRDQRRMARHLAHCQPCRRYARLAGVDLGEVAAQRAPAAAKGAKIAAWFPLPLGLRRRWGGEEAGQFVAQSHHGPIGQWSASLASTLDPGVVSGWSKAIATAATVAVAGVGAGAAIRQHHVITGSGGGSPSTEQHAAPGSAGSRAQAAHARAHHAAAAATAAAARRAAGTTAPHPAAKADEPPAARLGPAGQHGPLPIPAATAGSSGAAAGSALSGARPGEPARDAGNGGSATSSTSGSHPAEAAPSSTTAPVKPDATQLGNVLDAVGATTAGATGGGAAGTSSASPATTPPAPPAPAPGVDDVVGQTAGIVGALSAPPPAHPASAPRSPAAPATVTSAASVLLSTVGTTLGTTISTIAAGRTAP